MTSYLELSVVIATLGAFFYGVISMKSGVRDLKEEIKNFKDAITGLSNKLDGWVNRFSEETETLNEKIARQETRCEERTLSGKCKPGGLIKWLINLMSIFSHR